MVVKNRFAFHSSPPYDVVVCIATLPHKENQRRVKKILSLIRKYPPQRLSWNVYLAYEGKNWSDAVNKALMFLIDKVRYGVILLDDDAFPSMNWAHQLENYVEANLPFQFAMLGPGQGGLIHWKATVYKLPKPLSILLHLLTTTRRKHSFPLPTYLIHYQNIPVTKIPAEHIKIHRISFSACYLPKVIIQKAGRIVDSDKVLHYEDQEFSFRLVRKGVILHKIPNLVFHIGSATKGTQISEHQKKKITSRFKIYQHYFPDPTFLAQLKHNGLLQTLTVPKLITILCARLFSRFFSLEVVP